MRTDRPVSRRPLLGAALLLLGAVAPGISGCANRGGDERSSGSATRSGAGFDALPGAVTVASLPEGEVLWDTVAFEVGDPSTDLASEDRPVQTDNVVATSILLLADDRLYLGAAESLSVYDARGGALAARGRLGGVAASPRSIASIALASGGGAADSVLAACADGTLHAMGAEDLAERWSVSCAQATAVRGSEHHRRPDGTMSVTPIYGTVSWRVTSIACHGGWACVGFSSYSADPGSHLACVSLTDGSLAWTVSYSRSAPTASCISSRATRTASASTPSPERLARTFPDQLNCAMLAI